MWSQKDAEDLVTNRDFSGQLIEDPSQSNWSINRSHKVGDTPVDMPIEYQFVTYMLVPDDGSVYII
jgi:hypothetical protein